MARLTCFALVAVTITWASTGLAQHEPPGQRAAGEALLRSGKAAFDAGDYATALQHFEQAMARLGRPTIHYDIGQAAEGAGDSARALAAFREYLSALPNAPNRLEVEQRIAMHERVLADPDVAGAADVSPEAAAETQLGTAALETPSARPRGDGGELWWLWAGIGAAVVGTVVAALIVTAGDDPIQPPLRGDVGGTIQTLEVR